MPSTPSAAPLSWRRTMQAPNPTTANVVIKMSSGAVSGKYISHQLESGPDFISVMYSWSSRNGPAHHMISSTLVRPTVKEYQARVRSIQTRENTTAAPATKIRTIPCETHAAAIITAAHTRYLPVRNPAASRPSASMPSDSAIEKENSPAIVDLRLPP